MAAAQTVLVTQLTGQAWIRGTDGSLTPIHEGMRIPADAVIVTSSGGSVQLQADGQPPLIIGENQELLLTADLVNPPQPQEAAVAPPVPTEIDQILAAINAGQDPFADLDPTAAGLTGGSEGGSTFVRLAGILENTVPLAIAYDNVATPTPELQQFSGAGVALDATPPVAEPAPAIPQANADAGSTLEDAAQPLTGNVLANDTLGTGSQAQHQVVLAGNGQGQYGQLTLNADGSYSYQLDNGLTAVQSLAEGETVTESFTYTLVDANGVSSSSSLTITIVGTNDAPVLSGQISLEVSEDQTTPVTGQLVVTDVDASDTHTWTVENGGQGQYGNFTVDQSGRWTYVPGAGNPDVQGLKAGEQLADTITVTVNDGHGGTATQTVTVIIEGADDGAIITPATPGSDLGSVTEDGQLTAGGKLNVTDPDAGQAVFVAQNVTTPYGQFTIGTDGTWTYALDNANPAVQALGAGQTLTETREVRTADGTTANVVITINGTNDVPTLGTGVGSVTEDVAVTNGQLVTSGSVSISDIDAGQSSFQPTAVFTGSGTALGTLVFNTDGSYSYSVDNSAVQYLKTGDSVVETYTVTSLDGSASTTITITINGADDGAVIVPATPGSDLGSVTEDGQLTAGGKLNVTDPDAGQAVFVAQNVTTTYGQFTIGTDGTWTYALNNANPAVQALGAGQTLTETREVRTADGTTANVVITINGTNDVPTLGTGVGSVAEDVAVTNGQLVTSGSVSISDIDAGQNSFQPNAVFTGSGTALGTLVFNTDGTYSYSVDNSAVQYLKTGDSVVETYTVTSLDGSASTTITITINGADDGAVIVPATPGSDLGSVTEDGQLTAGGKLNVTDPDAGQAVFVAQNVTTTYGQFTIGTDGTWTYALDNANPAVQALGAGQTLTETREVRTVDGTTANVVITINGTNDVPTLGTGVGSVTEDVAVTNGQLVTSGSVSISDIDAGQSSFQPTAVFTGSGTALGTLVFNTDGSYSYSVDNSAVQYLKTGDSVVETYTVTSLDGSASTTITITINGADDGAVIVPATPGSDLGSVTEDGQLTAGGKLNVTDPDAGQAVFVAQNVTTTYGQFTIGTDGTWTYALNNANPAVQALGAGQTLTETREVRTADGTTANVVITINGTNDVPTLGTGVGSVTEDVAVVNGQLVTSGSVSIADIDAGQSSFQSNAVFNGTGTALGTLVFNTDGSYSYSVDNSAVQYLKTGDSVVETYTVTSLDGSASTTITITINGADDGAVIVPATPGSDLGSVTEDGQLTAGGKLNVTDPDAGQAVFVAQNVTTTYGQFTIGTDGTWTYALNNANPAVQALGAGQTLTETREVRTADGTTANVVITINGTNDVPTLGTGVGSVTEDVAVTNGQLVTSGSVSISDIDAGQSSFQPTAVFTGSGTALGTLVFNTDGSYSYSVNNSAVQYLKTGDSVVETYTVTSLDGSASTTITITINGADDAPSITGAATGAVTEDLALTATGKLTVVDADAGQSSFVAQTGEAMTYGTFTIDANGNWTYALDNANATVQALGQGKTLTEVREVFTADGTKTSVTITITGNNDEPTISGTSTGTVTEDGTTTIDGQLAVSDVDSTDSHTWSVNNNGAGQYGSFSVDNTGKWTYTLDNSSAAVQALIAGQSVSDTITVTVNDGNGGTDTQQITVTINGANDTPVITGAATGAVTEDLALTASGKLTVVDADAGQSSFVAQTGEAMTYGTFTIDANGNWTYALDNTNATVQALGQGKTLTEVREVFTADGTKTSVTITITGNNDEPTISGVSTGAVTEDGTTTIDGQLAVSDVDSTDTHTWSVNNNGAGQYGSFTVDNTGKWIYTLDNSSAAVQALIAGQSVSDTITVTVNDGNGGTDTQQITVTINGANDAPVITGAATGAVTEDLSLTAAGKLTVVDADAGQSSFVAQTDAPMTYGTFTIDANGNWTYALDNANATVQALGQGKTLTEVREVLTADGTKTSVTITITGNNDEPAISGTSTGAVTEDGTTTIDGQLAVSDVDSTDTHTWSVNNNGAGQYGSFTVDNTGKWTYTLDNSSAAVQALIAGQSVSDTITVTVNDGNGGTDTQQITVTINGANDVPVITGAATGAVTEDLSLTATGKLTVVDADAGQSSFVAQTDAPMTYGTFTIDANGNWTYALDNANATVQALGQGKTLTEVREVFTADGTKTSVTITITGNNDEPTISGSSTGAVTEDGTTTIDGQLAVSDVDSTDSHTWSVNNNGAGQYGSFSVDNTGKWTYTLDNSSAAVQALIAGQSVSDTITVTVDDGNGGTDTQLITVTINGANDAPVITGAATGAVTEDLALTATGKLTVVDADAGQSSFVAQTGEAMTYGTFTIDANGNWTYALDNANATVQALGQGKTLTEVREVFTADGTKTSVTITITGNNDEPTISGTSTGAVTEDGTTTIDGQLAVSDVDSTDSHTWSVNNGGAGQYGQFSVDATGKWTYTLDNSSAAVQALIAGQSVSDTITVTVDDGNGGTDTQQITVTINGANDAPVITGAATGAVTEDLALTATGKLTVVDADAGQSSFVAQTGEATTYGTFTIDANGNWTYALDNANAAVQALGQGKTLTEVREVFTADGTKTSVTITITGNNDEPTISGVSTGAVTEDGTTTIDGQLAVSDVDSTDTHTWSVNNNGAGQYGSFTVDNTGKWTYTLDNSSAAVQALIAGQSVSDTITVTVNDGNGGTDTQQITVTINGANDAPVITGAATGAVTEDLALTATGKLTVVDADAGQSSFVAQTDAPMTYGTFTIDANGNWTYALDNANATVQALGQGKTLTEVREVFTADGTKTSVTITITGNNDEPTISGTSTGTVTEDGTTTIDGQLAVADVDSTDTHTWSVNNNGAGQYGQFSVDATGKWTYTLDNSSAAVQALIAGQSVSDTITVTVNDGNGGTDTQQITVTINGANDAPVITGAATGAVTEDLSLTAAGKLTVVDADAGQSSFVAQTDAPMTYGTFTIDANGNWTYALDNANATVQALGQGKTLTEMREVLTADGTKTSVTITITGNNDEPAISGTSTGAVTEDGTTTIDGQLAVSDVDSTDTHTWSVNNNGAGQYGSFTVDNTGKWTYTLDNSSAAVQALTAGQSVSDTITVTVDDGNGGTDTQQITVTINGANDAPVITGAATGTVTEDLSLTTTGKLTVVDADAGQSSFVAQTGVATTYGTFTIDANGNWTYALNNANADVQALGKGETMSEVVQVTTADGSKTSVTITIHGNNDAPTISGVSTGTVTEDGITRIGGQLTVSDVDTSDTHTWSVNNNGAGQYGSFTVDGTGKWTYALDNDSAAVQALVANQQVSDTITVTVNDGNGGTKTQQITVTINGANDGAVVTGNNTATLKEDVTTDASGKLNVTDADANQSYFVEQRDVAVQYGKFTITNDGNWNYRLNNNDPVIQQLREGQTLTETVTVRTADGTLAQVNVTITGTNDLPQLSQADRTITENPNAAGGVLTAIGALTITDADAGEARFQTGAVLTRVDGPVADANTALGTLTFNADGSYSYSVDNSKVAYLKSGESVVETYTVTSFDQTRTSTIVIRIQGQDSGAVVTPATPGSDKGSVTEDGTLTTGGKLDVVDPDAGQAVFVAQNVTTTYGQFTIGSNGTWTYTLNNANPAVQALGAGQTLTETREVTTADGTKANVVITINGTNDVPTLGTGVSAVTEDVNVVGGKLLASGSVSISDVDAGQSSFKAGAVYGGSGTALGTLVFNTNGTYSYSVDNSKVQYLKTGESVVETYTVTSSDGSATTTIKITINGADDGAIISPATPGSDKGSVTEDGTLTTGGKLDVVDPDAGQAVFVAQNVTTTYGQFTIGSNGAWTYTLNNANPAVQALGAGQTLTETREVSTADGTKANVVITINGTNDVPTLGTGVAAVTEDVNVVGGKLLASGSVSISDVDAGQSSFKAGAVYGGSGTALGTLVFNTNGTYSYSVDNSKVQYLKTGESVVETYTVTSSDGSATTTIKITINGADDGAIISPATPGSDKGSVTEDGTLTTGGKLDVVDPDAGQAVFVAQNVTTTYGQFTIGSNGAWTYTLNNANPAVQALGAGQTLTETREVSTADGTKANVVITINGTNDVPTLGTGVAAVTEDVNVVGGKLLASGSVSISDVDAGQSSFKAGAVYGGSGTALGTLVFNTNGTYSYSVDNSKVQYLKTGESVVETYTVTSSDGSATTTIKITINGADDGAIISPATPGSDKGSVTEDGTLTTGGKLDVVDPDAGQAVFVAQNVTTTYGQFTIGSNGTWTYTLNNANPAVQALGAGQTLTETREVSTADGTKANVVITINGTNDVPTLGTGVAAVTEDVGVVGGRLVTSGSVSIADTDTGESSFKAGAVYNGTGTALGTLVFNTDGTYSYSVDNSKVQYLQAGEKLVETYTVTSKDGTASTTIAITITGANDIPTLSGTVTGAVKEDVTTTVSGQLSVTDVDLKDTHTWSVNNSGKGQYGSFTVDATGKWTYVLDNASAKVQALTEGQKVSDTITVTVNDGKGGTAEKTITVEITGTNEAPVAQAVTGTAPEDNTVAIALRGSDADGTVVSFQLTSLAANGTLYKDAAGTQVLTTKDVITATSNGATIYFKPTQDWSGTTSFNYSAKDNLGQVSTSTATGTITVTPVADTPTVSLSVGAGSNPVTTVINTATVSTTNTGHTVTANNADGSKGTVSIVTGTDHDGFGVSGNVSSNTGAASTELAGNGTVSESLTVAFKVPVTKITVQFAWLASGEQARYKMYDEAGNLIKTAVVQGKTDTVEEQFSLTAPVGTTIGKIVFDAPRNGDDYLVHKVTYTTATTYPLTITADPRDIDFSETISKVVVEVPVGVTLSAGTQIDATHWSVPLTSSGSYSVSVDATTKAVTITGLNMTVPENVTVGDIKVVATASDGASTADATYVYHGVPVANDDTATAALTSRTVTTAAKQDTLAAFSNNETTAWRFTSATTVDKDRVELSSTAVLKTDLGKWLSTSLQGTTLDAQTSGNALILRDNNDSSSGDAQLVTPVYSPTVDGTTLQFRVTGFSNFSSYFDIANWQLYKSADGGTTWSSQPVQRGDITSSGTIITGALEANASYRIVFTVEDNIGWGTGSAAIGLDDFQANVPATSSIEWSTTAINGSVTANDTLGTLGETSTVSVKVGSTWVDASAGGTSVTGSYGTLVLKSDGSYTYTPTASAAGAGKVDHFEYKLTQADGDTANANLDITLSATGPGAPVATLSARMVDTTSTHEVHGTSGSDTLLGTAEDDLFVWHQGDAGTAAKPVTDVVKNFGASGNDSLDLSDLLQGEESSTDLSKFLHLETKTEADGKTIDTMIKVSSAGALDADGNGFNQQILLEGVNLTTAGHDQNSMIKDLIDQGKLKIDHS